MKTTRIVLLSLAFQSLAILPVPAQPAITAQPRDQTVILYQSAAFGVIAAGAAPLTYQWSKDGVPIPGETKDQFVLRQAQFSDAGRYSVGVSDAKGSSVSADAMLSVEPPKATDLDYSFATDSSNNGLVRSIAVQPDGKVLIAGEFSAVSGFRRGGIARLNADGTLDHTFLSGVSGANHDIYSVALQSDGKVLIGGNFTTVNAVNPANLARLNRDGSLDASFQNGLSGLGGDFSDGSVLSIVVQSNGKVLVGGGFTRVNGFSRTNIARFNSDGTLDEGFQNGAAENKMSVNSIALQDDGKVLLGGYSAMSSGPGIARLHADGALDESFQTGDVPGSVGSIALQIDGKVLVAGYIDRVNGATRSGIVRLNSDGTLDNGFQNPPFGPDSSVSGIAVQRDGSVLVGGYLTTLNGTISTGIGRLNRDGTRDSSFQGSINAGVTALAVQSNGKVLIGHCSTEDCAGFSIERLHVDGTEDGSFLIESGIGGIDGPIYSVAAQPDGRVLIGGSFTTVNGSSHHNIARLKADGSLDSGFQNALSGASTHDPNLWSVVQSIAVQSDGRVLIGGSFDTVNGVGRTGIARLHADGTLDESFQNGLSGLSDSGFPGSVRLIVLQSDAKVLVAGYFNRVNGTARTNVVRLNADGTVDNSFQHVLFGPDQGVAALAVQSQEILIGGFFSTVNGQNRSGIARLNEDGTLDQSFELSDTPTSGVTSIAVQPDGKVLIGGYLTTVDDAIGPHVARLNSDGTLDRTFQSAIVAGTTEPSINAIAWQSGGKVLIGGVFRRVNGVSRNGFARLNSDGTLDSETDINGAVLSIVAQGDGKVLIGGNFTLKSVPALPVARLWGTADFPPHLKSISRSDAKIYLTWDTLPNRTYRVQRKEDLSANNWNDLAGDIAATSATASKVDANIDTTGQRFYRVLLLR